jgi:outer membrane protein with beta-barrel domain
MSNTRKIYLLTLLLVSPMAFAQQQGDACVQNIEIAQQRYDEGRIQDIQPLLSDCLAKGNYTKAEEAQALRLLALAYIYLEDEKQAEATMLRLLETYHEFQVNPSIDPTEFINLHEQFRYKPVFNLGVRYIFNFAQPMVTGLNSSLNLNGDKPAYDIQFSFVGIGVNFEYKLTENLILYPEIHYKSMAVSRTGVQSGTATGLPYISITNVEDQQWLSIPVSVKYKFRFKDLSNFGAYANLGLSADYLLSATRPADRSILQTPNDPEVGFTIKSTKDKNRMNFGAFAGGGVTYKLGEGFISLEARYLYSFTKLTKSENILNPTNPQQWNTGVQDDLYRLNHIAISVGYTRNIYLPKQLR